MEEINILNLLVELIGSNIAHICNLEQFLFYGWPQGSDEIWRDVKKLSSH